MQAYESMMHAFELLAWCSDIAGALYVQSRACYILKSIKSWADAHANLPTGKVEPKADVAPKQGATKRDSRRPSVLEGFVVSGSVCVLIASQLGMTSGCVTRSTPTAFAPVHTHSECKRMRLELPYRCSIVASLVLAFSGLSACH
jgi:hypothetical protein